MQPTKRMRNRNTKRATVFMVWAVLTGLLLSSCFPGRADQMSSIEKERKQAVARFKAIMEAIDQKDKDELKSMFSKEALAKAENLDENIDYIFTVLQGEVKSWEKLGTSVYTDNEYGDKRETMEVFFDIKTNKDKYILFFIDCTRDDKNSDGVGLYFLSIIKAEDDKKDWGIWNGGDIPGVYKPDDE